MKTDLHFLKTTFNKTKRITKDFTTREKKVISGLAGAILISALILIFQGNIGSQPRFGGSFTEGIIGSPRYINPVLSANNDPDMDVVELIFASLIKDLTKKYELSDDKKTYTLTLKDDILWHDGKPVTAQDVLFTIQTIQDPAFQSPLRFNFQGVGIEKIDDSTIKFSLKDVYAPFATTLDIGILPEHVWRDVEATGFALAEANIQPVGNGHYKLKKLSKEKNGFVTSIQLEALSPNETYIKDIELKFYPNEDRLIEAFKNKQIDNISYINPENVLEVENNKNTRILSLNIPRYFALFFNTDKIKKKSERQILAGAIDRELIIKEVLNGYGKLFGKNYKRLETDPLDLELNLVTADLPELKKTALLIKSQWEALGAKVNIEIVPGEDIQQEIIRQRDYDVLLFGEVLGIDPDPFAFWHSSQKKYPGLNLSLYDSTKADRLLVEARQEFNDTSRARIYNEFYDTLQEDVPAVFLYNPDYTYGLSGKIKGAKFNDIGLPSKRFSDIEDWFIKTTR